MKPSASGVVGFPTTEAGCAKHFDEQTNHHQRFIRIRPMEFPRPRFDTVSKRLLVWLFSLVPAPQASPSSSPA